MSWWLEAVVTVLAVYGMLTLLQAFWRWAGERRASGRPALSVIVVVRELERTIEGLIGELLAGPDGVRLVHDIVVVDLGSRDNTPLIVQRLARQYAQVHSLLLPSGLGVDEAFAAAVRHCSSPLVLCLDASEGTDLRLLRQTLAALGVDQALGAVRSDPA